ncbi:MAG: Asp-tRNA(Asn)/Glu-tRNA(Gln) amidotransferase GatCAB subunit B [Thaumarchaeota archaeon]|jgi:aspartyl-tRNA(Asn)/glutamyl-tRNA(Gln) amidotransferase subunit B|nr:MAG: Asp-tRNA(Asn)/Glu-tRNA(Gln) amidotransferase GatCAB subunit B [Nitrososphaerota archaeon]
MTKIGLEIHCQLTNLQSKLFCSCKANYREFAPNENICPVCAGIPGSLPRLNQEAVKKATMIAMALNCSTPEKIAFFRKNYFYPDLPKNFQITQLNIYGDTSVGGTGTISIGDKKIRITRIQLEEDPGRIIYEGSSSKNQITLVDYNRAGTPLVEIVTEPDFETPREVRDFLNILSDLLKNLGVADPSLEGAMRADANVSVRGGNKVEIKNIGSFHDLEKASHFEITRQESLHDRDIPIAQETRHWDDKRKITVSSRSKEEDLDYRYFLEGDIPWVKINSEIRDELKLKMPESISSKKERYISKYKISTQVADVLSSDKFYSDLFEKAHTESNAKEVANIITTELMGLEDTREKRETSKLTAIHLKELADAIQTGIVSRNSSKNALHEILKTGKTVSVVISELDLGNVSDESELIQIVEKIITDEPQAVEQAKSNIQTINYLVGKVMQATKGKADPTLTLNLLKKQIGI